MPSRGGRVAVYIEGHAESLERASAAGVASLDKLQAKTAEVDATQRSASTGGFASYTTATSKASKETEKHTRATGRLGKATDLLGSTLKTAAASSVAFIGTYAGYTALKDAVDYTSELTHQTQILTQATGLDVTAASQWIELAKQREISTTAVSVAFKTLSKQIRNAESGSTSAKKAFHAVGIPLDELKNMRPEEVVAKISDAFASMGDGAKKTALNAQFFGKSATALLPVLNQGSRGLEDQLNKFSGLSESQFKAGEQALEMERKISRAYDEIRLKVGVAMIGAGKSIAGWINDIGHGTGAVGRFIHDVGNILGPILEKDLKTASEAFKGFAQIWKGIAETLDGILHLRFSQMWQGIEDIFGGGAKEVVAIVKGIGRLIGGPVSAIGDALSGAFSSAWKTVEGVFTSGANTVIDVVNALIEAINVLPGVDIGSVGHIGGGKQYGQGKGEWHAGGKGLGGTSTPAHQGHVKKARGGPIDLGAPTGDTVPAMLERGEYVLNRKAVQAVGKDQLDYINFKHAPRYSVGSFIESAASTAFEYSPAGLAVKAGKAAFDFSKGVAGVVGGFPSGNIGGVFAGLGPWLVNKAVDYVKGWFGSHHAAKAAPSGAGPHGSLRGRATWFNGGATAGGSDTSRPGVALNLNPGTDSGWNNATTQHWMDLSRAGNPHYAKVTVGGHSALLPITDLGPAGWTGNAIDVTEGGVRKLGFTTANYPSGSTALAQYATGGFIKGSAGRTIAWLKNNVGTQQGSSKELKWASDTGGAVDPWCATFVSAAMQAQGLPLPANPSYSNSFAEGWAGGDIVGHSLADALPGDILIFNPTGGPTTDHVGIYIGGGQFISGNWSDEVAQASVSAEGGLQTVVRPHYKSAAASITKGGGKSLASKKPPKFANGAITAPKGASTTAGEHFLNRAVRAPAGTHAGFHGGVGSGSVGTPAIGSISKKQAIEEGRGLEWASHHLGSNPIEIDGSGLEQSLTSKLEESNKHLEELLALQREQTESANKVLAVVQANSSSIIGSLIATISGGIGGKVGLGFQTPSFAGGGASY